MHKVELLAPAGNLEKLKIACEFGADALYGGVSSFSLRSRSSKEFDYDTFKEGIGYLHERGKKIYVTINGFPFNSQITSFKKHIAKIAELNPDAFIVATPGVVKMAREIAPSVPLHLSTQANVMNIYDAEVFAEMGVSRIIAAREISLKDLEEIKNHLPQIELEMFVHGSMCFAYSGRCLISSLQNGRVPNRGSCANDCRFDYEFYVKNQETNDLMRLEEVEGEGTYIFNAKDLNLSASIDEILKSGVIDSIKIEGRTKSSYYAAVVTRTYREAIDDFYSGELRKEHYQEELNTTKNRGFTEGYLMQRPHSKLDTQNRVEALSIGEWEVTGEVLEDESFFMCKYKTYPKEISEIVLPPKSKIEACENEYGKIFKDSNRWLIRIDKIITKEGKELDSVHSGNLNPIRLPSKLPKFTFFRRKRG